MEDHTRINVRIGARFKHRMRKLKRRFAQRLVALLLRKSNKHREHANVQQDCSTAAANSEIVQNEQHDSAFFALAQAAQVSVRLLCVLLVR